MPAAERTHYQVLGIPVDATGVEIRRAYRSLAKVHHPDVGGTASSDEDFARIAQAYEVLSDRKLRAEYDRSLQRAALNGRPRSGANGPHYSWESVTAPRPSSRPRVSTSELDDLYDTFFGERRR